MTGPLTIALIGCGLWGEVICKELLQLGHSVRVFDPAKPSHADVDWVEMQQDVPPLEQLQGHDALIMATPASKTAGILRHLLPLDIPTFVEKPLALSPDQLQGLEAQSCDHVKMMHIWRYHPAVEALATLGRSGSIGDVLGIRSFRTGWTSPRKDIDTLWNLAVHDLTISKEILGHIPPLVNAVAERHKRMIRGAFITLGQEPYHWIEVSNRFERKIRELRLHGTEGVAVWHSDADPFVTVYHGDDRSHASAIEQQIIPVSEESAMARELKAFLAFATGGPEPKSDFREGVDVVERLAEIQTVIVSQNER